jgi:DNA-binding transcriptional LysR family regulator
VKHTAARNAPIDLNRLATFAAVAEAATFADAARRLGVQRSSISRSIAALEAAVGTTLFQRTTRQVTLTPEGAALHAQISPQIAGLREALRALPEGDDEVSGTLRLTTTVDFGTTLLPPIVASFAKRYPRVRLDLEIHNRLVDLVKEGFDAALRPQPAQRADSSLVSRKMLELVGHLYASPAYLAARGAPRTIDELAGHDWIQFRGRPLPPPAPKMGVPRANVDEMLFMREALKLDMGIGMLPAPIAQPDVVAGRLVRVLGRQVQFRAGLYLIHPPGRHLPRRVAVFRDHFLEQVQGPSPRPPSIDR